MRSVLRSTLALSLLSLPWTPLAAAAPPSPVDDPGLPEPTPPARPRPPPPPPARPPSPAPSPPAATEAPLPTASLPATDSMEEHRARGTTYYLSERYEDALREFRAAYDARQYPELLIQIARSYRKLGRVPLAIDYFQRYLAAAPDAPRDRRDEVGIALAQLRGVGERGTVPAAEGRAPPAKLPPGVELVPMRVTVQSNRGLLTGGGVALGTAYAVSLVSAVVVLGSNIQGDSTKGDLRTSAGLLLVPVAGPLLAAFTYRDPAWALPWVLVDGLAQISGLAMLLAGARDKQTVYSPVSLGGVDVQLRPYASLGPLGSTGGLMASGVF